MDKILLTGGTGFIGYNIALQLFSQGYHVRLFTRGKKPFFESDYVEYAFGDVRNYNDILSAMHGCNIVIHSAGLFTFDSKKRKEIYDINVMGTHNICRAILECKINRFIYTSSAATIGKQKGRVSDENTEFNLWSISSHYKKSKVLAEDIVWSFFKKYNIPVIVLNPSLPLGYYDIRPTSTGMMVKNFLSSKQQVYINGGFNFVHVKDVAKAHLLAINRGRIGEKYIIGHENMELCDFYKILQQYNRGIMLKEIPYFFAYLGSFFVAFLSYIRGKEPSVTPRGVQLSKKKMFYNSIKSQKELGLVYTPIEEAIKDSVEWFKKQCYGYT